MRVAVISDVHGNLPALEAVLEHADQEGIDELWCLGDIVGYGARPHECLALVTERAAICLGGNHDLVVSGVLDISQFTSDAGVAARWTRSVLTPDELELLAHLSPQGERAGVSLYHGSIRDPIWEYVLTADVAEASLREQTSDLALVGHSHVQLALALGEDGLEGGKAEADQEVALGRKQLLNPGSVGQPRDRDPRAAWLLLDTEAGWARFKRTPYAIERAQADIRAAGLPNRLADRLSRGL
ncbi:MAG TPA: metallophosphoesterase family protein [Gaiellales bacterium]|nr:metallophosphoesterase family protein [Gaiellales bacterium]